MSFFNPRHVLAAPPVLVSKLTDLLKSQPLERLTLDFERLVELEQARLVAEAQPPIAYDARLAMASAAFRHLPTAGIVERTLRDAIRAGWQPSAGTPGALSVLDFGAGTGAGSWGVHGAFPQCALESTLIDPSLPMIKTATHLSSDVFDTHWARNLVHLARGLKTRAEAARFDVVVASFALSELPSDDARALASSLLWDAVAVGGLLLIVEGHGPHGARIVRRAREELIAGSTSHSLLAGPAPAAGLHVVAPCGHNKPCPLRNAKVQNSSGAVNQNPFCFFQQHTERLIAPSSTGNPENRHVTSFSYVAMAKTPAAREARADAAEHHRVLRPPDKRKGHVYLDLCVDGEVQRKVVMRRQRELYKQARHAFWGASWPPPAGNVAAAVSSGDGVSAEAASGDGGDGGDDDDDDDKED